MKRQGKHKIIFIYFILIEHSNLTFILHMQNCIPVCIKGIFVNLHTIIYFCEVPVHMCKFIKGKFHNINWRSSK